jgi:hypothetical protein
MNGGHYDPTITAATMTEAKVRDVLANLKQTSGVNVFLLIDVIPKPVTSCDSLRKAVGFITERLSESTVICYETANAPSGFIQTIVKAVSRTGVETPMCPIYPLDPSTTRIDDSMYLCQELDANSSPLRKPVPAGTATVASILGPCFQDKPRILELLCDLYFITNVTIEGNQLQDGYILTQEDHWFSQPQEEHDPADEIQDDCSQRSTESNEISVTDNENDEQRSESDNEGNTATEPHLGMTFSGENAFVNLKQYLEE